MITQRRLQNLLAFVGHAHFGRAAQSLFIFLPALTKSIQTLDAELVVALLDRQRSAVALTAFGKLVAQRGRFWLTAEEDPLRKIAMLVNNGFGFLVPLRLSKTALIGKDLTVFLPQTSDAERCPVQSLLN